MNRIRNKLFKSLEDKDSLLKPHPKKSKFVSKGKLRPEKFNEAGNFLFSKCPTLKWCSSKKEFLYNKNLPKNKQYLKTKTQSFNRTEDYLKTISNIIKNFNKIVNYNDIYNLLKTMKKPKNIIYTFTTIDEPLLKDVNDDFETEMFGKINKKVIKEIQLFSLLDENKLEAELEKFYLNEGDKIIVFRFHLKKTALINYIIYVIENYFKKINYEDNKNKKKAFIFLVHMNIIFEPNEDEPKKENLIQMNELDETIFWLNDYDQIFIGNLNGENLSLADIMNFKDEHLFKTFFNLDNEFMKYINEAFSYFKYEFVLKIPGINIDNYHLKIKEFLKEQKDLRESIISCILRQKINNQEIFSIIKKIFLSRNNNDNISVFKVFLSELF